VDSWTGHGFLSRKVHLVFEKTPRLRQRRSLLQRKSGWKNQFLSLSRLWRKRNKNGRSEIGFCGLWREKEIYLRSESKLNSVRQVNCLTINIFRQLTLKTLTTLKTSNYIEMLNVSKYFLCIKRDRTK